PHGGEPYRAGGAAGRARSRGPGSASCRQVSRRIIYWSRRAWLDSDGWELAMRRLAGMAAVAAVLSLLSVPQAAYAEVVVQIDKSSQRMSVVVDGQHQYTWAVSTGVHGTPSGTFRPQSLSRNHRSSMFNNAPMPYSIFYDGNFAIHGTTQVARLGGPASHGC